MFVNVLPTGARSRVLRKFSFQPTNDLDHSSGLILFPGRMLQLMFLARLTTLLRRLTKLRLATLNVMIVGRSLINRVLIVRYQIAAITIRVSWRSGLLIRIDVRADHISRQNLRLNVCSWRLRRRVIPLKSVVCTRLSQISPMLRRYLGERRETLRLFPSRLMVSCRRGPRFRW